MLDVGAALGVGPAALTPARWVTAWSPSGLWLVVAGVLLVGYAWAVHRFQAGGGCWPRAASCWFVAGVGSLLLVTCSFLGAYSRVLFWPLAVQDVLLLALVPLGLTLGRPIALWRALRPRSARALSRRWGWLGGVWGFPLTGSVVAVTVLLLIYTTGWDQLRLEHPVVLELTRLLLLAVGCGFLWPLLGVDAGTGRTSYPVRALIAFVDGLLDALPGLAVLGTGHVIAAGYYTRVPRSWGPSPARAQQIGGTAMIALSEFVGLPVLLVLLLAWVRSDAEQAMTTDAALDVISAAENAAQGPAPRGTPTSAQLDARPWWEVDAGPLADRAARYGWTHTPADPAAHPTADLADPADPVADDSDNTPC